MGSGFTARSSLRVGIRNMVELGLDTDFYRMFTWLDYRLPINAIPGEPLTAQGDKGNTSPWIITPKVG